jgi:hypothetical protein
MFFKKQTFEQEARKYWEKLVCGILVPGERGCAPSEGEVLSMYNDMKTRHPGCKCNILRSGKGHGGMVQPGDKISGIRIVFALDAASSVEFILAESLYYVHFNTDGVAPFSHQVDSCDLSQTMKNIEDFVNNFPAHLVALEKKKIEFEKNAKLKEIARLSLKTSVAQMMSQMGYEWDLADREKYFLLRIEMGDKRMVEISLNDKNFAKRIPIMPEMLKNIERMLETMPFPVDISMTKEFLKN